MKTIILTFLVYCVLAVFIILFFPYFAGVTDAGMVKIGSRLSSLRSLDVSYCRKLTDMGLSAVAEGCPDLRALRLPGCRFVTDEALLALSVNCPYLEELALQGCSNITDLGLISLANGCKRIKFLDLNKCSNVGDTGVSRLAKACSSSLSSLKLLDCYKIGDDSVLSLAEFSHNLETLIIGGCRGVSDESIKLLAAACKINLKNLRMDWCMNICDSSVSCLLNDCRNLEALDIGCCEEVTDAAFNELENKGHHLSLKVLKINNCPRITLTSIQILVNKCNLLEYLDVRSCPNITKAGCEEAGLQFAETCKVNFTGNMSEPDVLL